jgi:hypothetical protein
MNPTSRLEEIYELGCCIRRKLVFHSLRFRRRAFVVCVMVDFDAKYQNQPRFQSWYCNSEIYSDNFSNSYVVVVVFGSLSGYRLYPLFFDQKNAVQLV